MNDQTNAAVEINDPELDSLLDGNLEDLAELPPSGAWPAGMHLAIFEKFETKSVKDKKVPGATNSMVVVTLKAVATQELKNPDTDTALVPGQQVQFTYFLRHHSSEMAQTLGQGAFRQLCTWLAGKHGSMSNRDLINATIGAEVAVVTGIRKQKGKGENAGNEYINTTLIELTVL